MLSYVDSMNIEYQKLLKDKDLILNAISTRGPSLPIHLAKVANISTLFASAYLSELFSEKKVLMSNLKVGSTSLYYLQGQESQLENFVQYLNQKEREAFLILKNGKVLDDQALEPAIRVAIKEIKDFAHPITLSPNGEPKLFWKYFSISNEEAGSIIAGSRQKPSKSHTFKEPDMPENKEKLKAPESIADSSLSLPEKKPKKKKTLSANDLKFSNNMKGYLQSKEIEILSLIEEKKKDFTAKIRIDTLFGKQEYLLIAKDKKKITEEDILIALHKAHAEKAIALFMAPGDPDKTALLHIKEWRNLIKFEKIKF